MQILKNSIWKLENVEGVRAGLYRVIHLFDKISCLVLFYLEDERGLSRPLTIELQKFEFGIHNKDILEGNYSLPPHLFICEEEIDSNHLVKRNEKFKLVKDIVNDYDFLFDYSTKKRMTTLAEYAKKRGKDRKSIARLLDAYWRYGQDKNAFLPAYQNSGGSGKQRKIKDKCFGAPKTSRTLAIQRSLTFKLSNIDKDNIRKEINKHHLKPHGKNLKQTHEELLRTYYADEVKRADALGEHPYVPSYKQVTSWKKKLFTPGDLIKKSTTEQDYLLNKRGLLGNVTEKWPVPGSCFEIDATVADVHIVSSFGKQYPLGRPTIYSIVDRASAMIVGLNVSLYYASWRAARQALANAFLPKSEYCKEFGVVIQDSDWPTSHIPQRLMCDNGEMIGLQPQKLIVPLTELQLSPPYRPDFKAMVERRFGLLNKELIHSLLGTTRGGQVVRGDKDPRKDAIYTLYEFTSLLIEAVLELNRSTYDSLATSSPLLIEKDLLPTPLNFWKVHLSEHKHALKVADSDDVISRLYPPAKTSMTRNGLEYNKMYYSCDRVLKENLASISRAKGRWKLDCRINENTTNYIYVKFDKSEGFTKCNLLRKSKMLKNLPMHESEFVLDWLDTKKDSNPISVESIENQNRRRNIEKSARFRAKKDKLSFAQKTRNIRGNRNHEINTVANPIDRIEKLETQDCNKTKTNVHTSEVVYLPRRRNEKGK